MEELTGIGVGGIFAVLVLREVFGYLKNRRDGKTHVGEFDRLDEKIDCIRAKVRVLYRWHDVTDEDGVPVWYVRRSLERAVERMADATEKMASLIESIAELQKQVHEKLKEL